VTSDVDDGVNSAIAIPLGSRSYDLGNMSIVPCLASVITAGIALGVTGCGSPSGPTRSPAAPTHSPTPAPTPTLAPDQEVVTVTATGVGTFDLATIPVAVLQNTASRHGAAMVVVHFVTHRSDGRTLGSLDSVPVNLGPGETLAVTADCTDACVNASGTDATVAVGAWVAKPGVLLAAGAAAYSCGNCGAGHGHGDTTGSITAPHLADGAAVVVFASCSGADGSIVGGGSEEIVWPGGPALNVDVPVLVNSPPASCRLGASTGW
jgi:hypothetical protein